MAAPRGDYNNEQDRRVRGTEVFVGGLPRSATEGTLREVFCTCGEIVDVRIMKDQNGISKGYGFVRFSKREYANTARRKKNGFQLQGKKLDVDLSLDQDTLFFGNLHKVLHRNQSIAMANWSRSNVTMRELEDLVEAGLLRPQGVLREWMLPMGESKPAPPPGYVVSFLPFHERGVGTPAHDFFRALLHFYEAELHHLNPNGVQQIATFVALCEGFLGVGPCLDLFRYFFSASLYRRRGADGELLPVDIGSVGIHLKGTRAQEYIPTSAPSTNQGWHQRWFYIRNDTVHPIPAYTGRRIEEQPDQWRWGVAKGSKEGVPYALEAIRALRDVSLTSAVVVGSYHHRRYAPLMARSVPLFLVGPDRRIVGDTVMAADLLDNDEVSRRMRLAVGSSAPAWPIEGAPAMIPDPGAVNVLQGKKLDVDLSLDQDTLFFGNLHKEWCSEEFEELIHKTFKDVVSVDLAMTSNSGSSNKRHLNRGFAFVRFSSHGAAARVIHIGSRTDFLLGGIVHPSINWAEKDSHVDSDEMTKIKAAFVGNLPENVTEVYLRKLFERYGEVERVVISRKGQCPVGFVHFAHRIELDRAIEEMDGKTVRGPDRGPPFMIQVSVARPAIDNDRKRTREDEKARRPNMSRDRPDYSYERHGHGSHDRQGKAPRFSNTGVDITDPYESAICSLPSAAKELLLRILRLGIGTRYDIDIHCINILNELPEPSAVAVLNQFLISGGDKRNKGDYFASLIVKHQGPLHRDTTFGLVHTLHGTYLPRNPEIRSKRFPHEDYDYMTSGNSRYRSAGNYPSSYYADDPPMSEPRIRRYVEERPTPEPRPRQENIRRYPEATLGHESRHNTGKFLDRRYTQEQISKIERSPEESILWREQRHGTGYNTDIGPEYFSRSSAEYSLAHQVRFDPFTGEPYKFDPFTGEPIRSEPKERRSGSLY